MKKQVYLVAALLSLSMVPLTSAQANEWDMRPYMGVGLGAFNVGYKDSRVSQTDTGFGGFIKGGADFGEYFGLEMRLGTTSNGSTSYAAGTLGASAGTLKASTDYFVSYLAKVQMPVSNELRPYALLGGTTAVFKTTNSVIGWTEKVAKSGLSYGVGVDYNLGNQLSVNVEWMQYWNNVTLGNKSAGPGTSPKAKFWGLVAGLDYHF
jgi:opacity protein-like surface antigen